MLFDNWCNSEKKNKLQTTKKAKNKLQTSHQF